MLAPSAPGACVHIEYLWRDPCIMHVQGIRMRLRGDIQWLYNNHRFSSNLSNYISFTPKLGLHQLKRSHAEGLKQSFRRHAPRPPSWENYATVSPTVPIWVGQSRPGTRFPTNSQSGKKISEMYEDIDAPSVVTELLYQLKYADAVSSSVM